MFINKPKVKMLDTVNYWAFCIADAYREEIDKIELGCDEIWCIAEYFAHRFVKSSDYHNADISGYDALMRWCDKHHSEITQAIQEPWNYYED